MSRGEYGIDKNGNRWSFRFTRRLPSTKGSATDRVTRELLLKVPETSQILHDGTGGVKWHGHRCDGCLNWPTCVDEIGVKSASANYCTRLARGYTRLGKNEMWPAQTQLKTRKP